MGPSLRMFPESFSWEGEHLQPTEKRVHLTCRSYEIMQRQELQARTWRQELKQRPWRSMVSRLAPHWLAQLTSLYNPSPLGWALLHYFANASQTWWRASLFQAAVHLRLSLFPGASRFVLGWQRNLTMISKLATHHSYSDTLSEWRPTVGLLIKWHMLVKDNGCFLVTV